MALRANRPGAANTGNAAGAANAAAANTGNTAQYSAPAGGAANAGQYSAPAGGAAQYSAPGNQQNYAPTGGAGQYAPAAAQYSAPPANSNAMHDLNSGILDNIDGMDNIGNFVTMDGTNFLYKATEAVASTIDLIVSYGKRYYQWVDDSDPENKVFHDSDTRIDDRYKLRFEIHWEEEYEEGEITEVQFHMPAASGMRFIDYVKELAKAGYGIGQVVTRMSISRQVQKNTSNRYSRAEFTMIGIVGADGNIVDVPNGITTVGKK